MATKELSSDYVNNYFSQINPLAARVAKAISETKTAYGVLWYTLNNSDQNEIINETLIKPEITLHYIDNLSTKKSSSYTSLDCSLTDNIIQDFNQLNGNNKYYGFDGRNLRTYAAQKTAQKLQKDDAMADAGYRDEHSAPFSYRTRSQINFHLGGGGGGGGEEITDRVNEINKYNAKSSNNLDKLIKQQQLVLSKKTATQKQQKPTKDKDTQNKTQENNYMKTGAAADLSFNYLQYTHQNAIEHEAGEKSSLIQSPENGTAISDEEEQEYYHAVGEQQLEEVKLLDSHVTLKRGFEFLNNW